MLCVPIENDQFINCEIVEEKQLGKLLLQEDFNNDNVYKNLNQVITDQQYTQGLTKFKKIMNSYKGKKRAAEIILGVAKTGTGHLISRFKDLPWYQRNELDIFCVFFIVICFFTISIKKYCFKNK